MEAKKQAAPAAPKERQKLDGPTLLFARRMGFVNGVRVRAGQEFLFHGPTLPRWAVLAGSVEARLEPEPQPLDTRPAATRAASKAKTVTVPDA